MNVNHLSFHDQSPARLALDVVVNTNVDVQQPLEEGGFSLLVVALDLLMIATAAVGLVGLFLWAGAHRNEAESSKGKIIVTIAVIAIVIEFIILAAVTGTSQPVNTANSTP